MIGTGVHGNVATEDRPGGRTEHRVDAGNYVTWSRLGPALCVVGFLLLVLSGATSSSIGLDEVRADPAHPTGVMLGTAKGVRADEWLTATPVILGYMASGSERATHSPLSEANDLASQLPNQGVGERIVFFDTTALRFGGVVPEQMLFAGFYWLPTLLLMLFLPPWLRRVGSNAPLAWLATVLVLLAPANAWWSLMPTRVLGFAVAACYLTMLAADRYRAGRRLQSLALAVGAGIFLARSPFFYPPWQVTMAVPVVLATAVWLLWPKETRVKDLLVLAVVTVTSVLLVALTLAENLTAFRAQAGTVYPGRRISGALAQSFGTLFGAPNLGYLQTSPSLNALNYSELSTGFTICGLWALVIWASRRGSHQWTRNIAVQVVLAVFLIFWFTWSAMTIPGSELIPIVNLVPSERSAQTLGFLAVLLLALVLSQVAESVTWRLASASAIVCTGVTAIAGLALHRSMIPSMTHFDVLIGAIGVGAVVLLVTRYPGRGWPVGVATLSALALVVTVNPLIFGLGDLRNSPAAKRMSIVGQQARNDGTFWATNSSMLDALVIANGVPSLSGHQTSGPHQAAWHKLDPTDTYISVWNRGSSYLMFEFTTSKTSTISLGSARDQMIVSVDPCRLPSIGFPLAGVISTTTLTNSCLQADGTVMWSGAVAFVYTLKSS